MSKHSLVIAIDGTVEEVVLPRDEDSSLTAMYKAIDCRTVDVVRLTSRMDMWVDNEGLYTAPLNPVATLLARFYGYTHQGYHGRALICGMNAAGDSVNLTDDQARAVRTQAEEIRRSWNEFRKG